MHEGLTLAVVGVGLIGRSVSLAARRRWPDASIIEVDRTDRLESIAGAEMAVLAAPVDAIIDLVPRVGQLVPGAVVLDTGSTKRQIIAAARRAGVTRFVGGHPMAGAATTGPAQARADLFDGKPWFLVPAGCASTDREAASAFVAALGARPVVLDDDGAEHDRIMAAVSHLPQIVAAALMTTVGDAVGPSGLAWGGAGLADTTRLAQSSAKVWESILATNADQIRPLLRAISDHLGSLADHLDDAAVVRDLFERANHDRDVSDRAIRR